VALRIREGDYAYDLEQRVDPLTQVRQDWKFTMFLVFPSEQILERGVARTREEAEHQAQRAIARIRGEAKRAA
jgi:hypothetical protein